MPKVLKGKFRLLLNFALALFGRKPTRVRVEVEWENLPYSWQVDWYKEQGSDTPVLTTKRVKPRQPK